MAVAPARVAAYHALQLIDETELGDALTRTRDALEDPRDRALATDLVIGTLRWRAAIDYQLAHFAGRRLTQLDDAVLTALRLGAYQLLHLERVPASAVVNDSVSLVKRARLKSAAPFVNAVLRRLARERGNLSWPSRDVIAEHLAVVHSHPQWLVERWIERHGVDAAEAWLRFNNEEPALGLAVNRLRTDRDALAAELVTEGVTTTSMTVAPNGLNVVEGRALASDAFRRGACVVQDQSSQLIAELVGACEGERVFDACAAPGGKTVALAAQVGLGGLVVAADVRPRRMRTLAATMMRCGVDNARLVQMSPTELFPFRDGCFDRVLVDAPCSGLGTLRRDPDIKWKRSAEDLTRFAVMQIDLLTRASRVVRRGGRLVYSTCSSEPEENEAVVAAFLEGATDFAVTRLQTLPEIAHTIRRLATPDGFLRTDPGRDRLEAFFGAVLERT
jgi:16S rRNA (cytosine967-C5)-methyltransferase